MLLPATIEAWPAGPQGERFAVQTVSPNGRELTVASIRGAPAASWEVRACLPAVKGTPTQGSR